MGRIVRPLEHKIRYINWTKEATHKKVEQKEWNEIVSKLNGSLELENEYGNRTVRKKWLIGSHKFSEESSLKGLYLFDEDCQYKHYFCYEDDDKNDKERMTGRQCYKIICEWFEERTGKKLRDVFGVIKREVNDEGADSILNKDGTQMRYKVPEIDLCRRAIPAIIWANRRYYNDKIDYVWKADISSAYPAQASKTLPTTIGMIRRKGRVEPNSEYPFAFYVKSGHHAVYGEYSTEQFENHWQYIDMDGAPRGKFVKIKPEDDETILMKSAPDTLRPEMEKLYALKSSGDADAKDISVKLIGYICSIDDWQNNYMGHLSTVIYGRHIKRMLDIADNLKENGNNIIMIATDCFAAKYGMGQGIAQKEKELGALVLEYECCSLGLVANGVYCIEDKGEIKIVKHQGQRLVKKPESIDDFLDNYKNLLTRETVYDKKSHLFKEKEVCIMY